MSVALAYIYNDYGNLQGPFVRSLIDVLRADPEIETVIDQSSSYIADGRNKVVEQFLRGTDEWLWFVDVDVIFPPTILAKLLERADGDRLILAAPYPIVINDRVVTSWVRRGERTFWDGAWADVELLPLAACGMGCTLIGRPVLEALRDVADPDDPWMWFGHDLVEGFRATEDVSFCRRAQALGFSAWGVPLPLLGHQKTRVLPR